MPLEIPCDPALTHYQMQIVLGTATYTLEFKLNTREDAWYWDLKDQTEDPIISGMRMVVDWPMGFRTTDPRRPAGVFLATDTTGKQKDPGAGELGGRVKLEFWDASELA